MTNIEALTQDELRSQCEESDTINDTPTAQATEPSTDSILPFSPDDEGWVDVCNISDSEQREEPITPTVPEAVAEDTTTPPSLETVIEDTTATSALEAESTEESSPFPRPEEQRASFVVFVDTEKERIALANRLKGIVTVYTIDDAENCIRVIDIADNRLFAVHIADNTGDSFENGNTWVYMLDRTAKQYGREIPTYRIDVSCIENTLRHGKTVIDLCNFYTEGILLNAFLEQAINCAIERKNCEELRFELTLSVEDLANRGDEPGIFPVDSFPPPIRDMVLSLQRYMQHEKPDMCAVFALGMLSGASMRRFVASHPANGYQYHPNLYVYFMAESSGRKSSAIKIMSAPYMEYQEELKKEAGRDRSKAALHLKRVNAKLTAIEKEYTSEEGIDSDTDRDDEYADLCEKKEEYEYICKSNWDIFLPHGNITIQAIPERLDENHGMMTLIAGEDTIIQKLLRYENDKTEIDVFLDGKDGNAFGKERVVSGKLSINHPLIAMIIAGQSKYFKAFVSDEAMKNKGLTARFLFAGMDRKKVARNESDTYRIPPDVTDNYSNHISRRLREFPILEDYGELMKKEIAWSDEAKQPVIEYMQKNIADEELEGKLFAGDNDWSGKQEQATCSIIAILHVDWCLYRNEDPFKVPISAETVQKGIAIHRWFMQEFRYWVMHESLMTDRLNDVIKSILSIFKGSDGRLRKKLSDTITPSQIARSITKSRRPKAKDLQEPLDLLESLGYLIQDKGKQNTIRINPYLFR